MQNRMETLRKPLGLSQHRLAKRVDSTRITINRIERGYLVPKLSLAARIAEVLEVSLYEVFDLDGTGRFAYFPKVSQVVEESLSSCEEGSEEENKDEG